MTFPHREPDFDDLLAIVAEQRGLSRGLVEKDYWVTHTLWALHDLGFDIWFKGGTSLSKGFGLITRFSEDLDVRIDPGAVAGLDMPMNWTSGSRGVVKSRRAYFVALGEKLAIPDVEVRCAIPDRLCRNALYEVRYPGGHLDDVLTGGMRPFVLIEAGVARVTPFVRRDMGSLVHDFLRGQGRAELLANIPKGVRCVHPLVTLLDKLDAISSRFDKGKPAGTYARHYEDAARIIGSAELPPLPKRQSPSELAAEMLQQRDIRAIPEVDDPAFSPAGEALENLERACLAIAGMYWGERLSTVQSCTAIREWIETNL